MELKLWAIVYRDDPTQILDSIDVKTTGQQTYCIHKEIYGTRKRARDAVSDKETERVLPITISF